VPHPSGTGDHIPVDGTGRTSVPGVCAAGNVTDIAAQVGASAAAGAFAAQQINADLVAEDTSGRPPTQSGLTRNRTHSSAAHHDAARKHEGREQAEPMRSKTNPKSPSCPQRVHRGASLVHGETMFASASRAHVAGSRTDGCGHVNRRRRDIELGDEHAGSDRGRTHCRRPAVQLRGVDREDHVASAKPV
jgi:hypothetical protein